MSQHFSAHEELHADLLRYNALDHPAYGLQRRLIEEHGIALQAQAVAVAEVIESRRTNARLYEDLMGLISAASMLAEVCDWPEHEQAVAFVRETKRAYGTKS